MEAAQTGKGATSRLGVELAATPSELGPAEAGSRRSSYPVSDCFACLAAAPCTNHKMNNEHAQQDSVLCLTMNHETEQRHLLLHIVRQPPANLLADQGVLPGSSPRTLEIQNSSTPLAPKGRAGRVPSRSGRSHDCRCSWLRRPRAPMAGQYAIYSEHTST